MYDETASRALVARARTYELRVYVNMFARARRSNTARVIASHSKSFILGHENETSAAEPLQLKGGPRTSQSFYSAMSQQTTVGPPASRLVSDSEERQEEREETTNFLYSYVFSRSSADASLSSDQVEVFQTVNREVGVGEGAAIEVGRRLAQLGRR